MHVTPYSFSSPKIRRSTPGVYGAAIGSLGPASTLPRVTTHAPKTRLTSVYGSFRAKVLVARLQDAGFDVTVRGSVDGPYAVTVGELARVDVFLPADQIEDASLLLLVDEVDEADDVLDDDRPPLGPERRVRPMYVAVAAVLLVIACLPLVHVVHHSW